MIRQRQGFVLEAPVFTLAYSCQSAAALETKNRTLGPHIFLEEQVHRRFKRVR
jgi:hypothetical protein